VTHGRRRLLLGGLWAVVIALALWLFAGHRDLLSRALLETSSRSFVWAAGLYLVLGCLRGFTLIPSTTLVLVAVPFFPPGPLLGLTLAGILVSSSSIYWFAEALHLDEIFESLHGARLQRLRTALSRYELPVIVLWSFFPLAPTDLICYVCGIVGVRYRTCLLGVFLGEGAICALYIFAGDALMRAVHLRA
jgi:uncharacterized membrane protein YdjX (TVP38/TMEM64 family)